MVRVVRIALPLERNNMYFHEIITSPKDEENEEMLPDILTHLPGNHFYQPDIRYQILSINMTLSCHYLYDQIMPPHPLPHNMIAQLLPKNKWADITLCYHNTQWKLILLCWHHLGIVHSSLSGMLISQNDLCLCSSCGCSQLMEVCAHTFASGVGAAISEWSE